MLWFVHATKHDHKTHTCSSALDPLPMLWGQMSIWGHLGHRCQKFIFTKYAITHPCYTARPLDSYMYITLRPSAYVMESNANPGSFGVTRIKRLFSIKCYNLSMLHSMTIRLIHVDQLETLLWLYVVKCQSGVIWGHWVQKVIWTQNALTRPCYTAWP